jgi:fucose permease
MCSSLIRGKIHDLSAMKEGIRGVIDASSAQRKLAAICLANLAYALSSSMLGPSLPTIISSLSLDAWQIGAVASASAIGFLSVIPGGIIVDRKGKGIIMLMGLLIEFLSCSLIGVSPSFPPLLLGLAIFGIGAGFWEVAVSSFIPDNFADNPSGPMNILHSTWGIGGFLGPVLMGLMISLKGDWHPSFMIAAASLAIADVVIMLMKFDNGQIRSADLHPLHSIRSMPKGAVVVLALEWGVESSLYAYLPLLLELERGFGTLDASAALSLLLLTIAAGRICWSKLSGRMGMVKTIKISGIMTGVSILAIVALKGQSTLLPILSTGFFISCLAPTILAYIGDRTLSSGTGIALGLTLSAASIGGAVIPASSALIAGRASMSTAFVYLGALLLPTFLLVKGQPMSTQGPSHHRLIHHPS